jgi:hypothetical protein
MAPTQGVGALDTKEVPADLFSRFADGDLPRWRALRGCVVVPGDERWGEGLVRDIRWEGRSDLPHDRGTIYLSVEYADGLQARVNARAFARHHHTVRIEPGLADFVERWFGDPDAPDDDARILALAERDGALRAEQDAERQRRVEELRRLVRARRAAE